MRTTNRVACKIGGSYGHINITIGKSLMMFEISTVVSINWNILTNLGVEIAEEYNWDSMAWRSPFNSEVESRNLGVLVPCVD